MKLRIRDNSIRLRLNKKEVELFERTGVVRSETEFGATDNKLSYEIQSSHSVESLHATFKNQCIQVWVPVQLARHWALTDQVSLMQETPSLRILIEKDFHCLKPRDLNEDESEMFTNPNTTCV